MVSRILIKDWNLLVIVSLSTLSVFLMLELWIRTKFFPPFLNLY